MKRILPVCVLALWSALNSQSTQAFAPSSVASPLYVGEKMSLNFQDVEVRAALQLLADVDGRVCERYGVWQEKEKDGVKKMGIVRSTFVIDKQGNIVHALYGVQAKGHAAEILNIIKDERQVAIVLFFIGQRSVEFPRLRFFFFALASR